MKNRSIVTVGLLWHSVNSDNLGVGALTVSQIAILEEVARKLDVSLRFEVLGWVDEKQPYIRRSDVGVLPMRALDLVCPAGLYSAVRHSDIVLDISAGDSFADIYGARRFVYNAISKLVVLLARRPLLLSPQTIGPFQRWWSRLAAGVLMRRACRVVTRDHLSTIYAEKFHLPANVVEATDVAFRLPYELPTERPSQKVRFGFNVSGLLFNRGYDENNTFALKADYPLLARLIMRHFSVVSECEIHLIGHVNSERNAVEDDYRVLRQLAAEFPGVVIAPRFETPSAAKSYIATMDFFCGSRMHACIAAFSSGVPVLPIAYSRKFAGLFGSLGYAPIADCKSQSEDEILRTITDAYYRRDQLRMDIRTGRDRAEAKLSAYEKVLQECIVEVLRKRR